MLKQNSPIPLYIQLQDLLQNKIHSGELEVHAALPTEAELARQYNVSRATVREALRALVDLGLIEKRHGLGSFVKPRQLTAKLPGLNSFRMEMRSQGHAVKTHVLDKAIVSAPAEVAEALDVEAGSPLLRLKRLRFVDNEPILVSESYLPSFVSIDDDFSDSVYELFNLKYGLHIVQGQATIEAGLAEPEIANLLKIGIGAVILRVIWIAQTEDDRAIEYSDGIYRGDSYRYVIHLQK